MRIKETIVVEGRDDTAAIKRSVDALTIETHGYGIRPETWDLIAKAYETTGIIVFTDPDHAGEQIRGRILERLTDAKEAFLDRDAAEKDGDIGIENASPEAIRRALEKVQTERACGEMYTSDDMFAWGLTGRDNYSELRRALGKELGIGFATAKTFLARLNKFGEKREDIESAVETASKKLK